MSRLLWMLAGLVGGISLGRNAEAFDGASAAAVLLLAVVACGVTWFAAYRGKSVAVATAVATAEATAAAEAAALSEALAEARAQAAALAQVVVNVPGAGGVHEARHELVDGPAPAIDGSAHRSAVAEPSPAPVSELPIEVRKAFEI